MASTADERQARHRSPSAATGPTGYTDGIERHIADLSETFVWAPDTHVTVHPVRIAKDNLSAVTGVLKGTFTRPMPDGKGGFIAPTG